MARQTIRLQTNIPITGTVKYVDFIKSQKEEYGDQISVSGDWDGAGDGRVYLHLALEGEFQKLGIIGERGGNGSYKVLIPNAKIQLVKEEQGTKKFVKVTLIGGTKTDGFGVPGKDVTSAPRTSNYQPGASMKKVTVAELEQTYRDCFDFIVSVWPDDSDSGDIAAATATMFIARSQAGLYSEATENIPV